jgi:hypothetical protein
VRFNQQVRAKNYSIQNSEANGNARGLRKLVRWQGAEFVGAGQFSAALDTK